MKRTVSLCSCLTLLMSACVGSLRTYDTTWKKDGSPAKTVECVMSSRDDSASLCESNIRSRIAQICKGPYQILEEGEQLVLCLDCQTPSGGGDVKFKTFRCGPG